MLKFIKHYRQIIDNTQIIVYFQKIKKLQYKTLVKIKKEINNRILINYTVFFFFV